MKENRREEIRRQFRVWRAAKGLTQEAVQQAARDIYPEFGAGRFWKIENGLDYATPSERKALAQVLGIGADELPDERAIARAS